MSGMATLKPKVEALLELIKNYRQAIDSPGTISHIILPKGCAMRIGDYAFCERVGLENINIDSDCTYIGKYAFKNCRNLRLTSLPETVTEIGEYAFQGCKALTLTKLPDALTVVGIQAFNGGGLQSELAVNMLPPNLISIGAWAFGYCPKITISRIPASVQNIGEYAFAHDFGIETLVFEGKPHSIHRNAFYNCSNIVDIKVPWSEDEVSGAPWGAINATITYNSK